MTDHDRVSQLFLKACGLEPEERAGFLEEACAGDAALRAEVEAMLAEDARAGGTEAMAARVLGAAASAGAAPAASMPRAIGPYRILERLGEGGMGVVYRAEQMEPIRREVALKVIRWGADSAGVVARFEAERQMLASMDHPNIARLFDAGADAEGRPYFAMERIQGAPITDYCKDHRLAARERLKLFLEVCKGVRHAHRHGVIHRDLKPWNVLVTEAGGAAVPKVIDFSIAKALGAPALLTEHRTRTGQVVGTLEYMSPEQARGDVTAVDTRADVWALGVILYELLADRLPHDLAGLPLHEAVRRICDEPARPLRGTATTATGRVDADLGTIIGKCLAKEPDRRYGSAAELVDDLERHLGSRPILARPPSAAYVFGKLVARHKVGAAALAAILLALAGFGATMAVLYGQQRRARIHAEHEARRAEGVTRFWEDLFADAGGRKDSDGLVSLPEVLERVRDLTNAHLSDPEVRPSIDASVGTAYRALLRFDDAIKNEKLALLHEAELLRRRYPEEDGRLLEFERVVRGEAEEPEAPVLEGLARSRDPDLRLDLRHLVTMTRDLAYTMLISGDSQGSVTYAREGLAAAKEVFRRGDEPLDFLRNNLASALRLSARYEEALALQRKTVAEARAAHGDDGEDTIAGTIVLGSILFRLSRFDEAESTLRDALERARRVLGDHANTGMAEYYLGSVLQARGRFEEALALHREHAASDAARAQDRYYGAALLGRGSAEAGLGMRKEAEGSLREALRLLEGALGPDDDRVLRSRLTLGVLLLAEERLDEAEAHLLEALNRAKARYGNRRADLAEFQMAAGWLLLARGNARDAEPLLRRGTRAREDVLPPGDGRIATARVLLGSCLATLGRTEEAGPLLGASLHGVGSPAHPLWQYGALRQAARFYASEGEAARAAALRDRAARAWPIPAPPTETSALAAR